MKERPIIFNSEMIRAILDGRKTQTRRILKVQPSFIGQGFQMMKYGISALLSYPDGKLCSTADCTYGQPRDRIWVRETLHRHKIVTASRFKNIPKEDGIRYSADGAELLAEDSTPVGWQWDKKILSAIHMPRWASRITLEIVSVRVERLQDISEEDARAEGISKLFTKEETLRNSRCNPKSWRNYLWHGLGPFGIGNKKTNAWDYQYSGYEDAKGSFSSLWESINGPGAWDKNPFVWVLEFKRI